METAKKIDDHMTSAAAFVEGGVQQPCDDACSICLEVFSQSDPSTVTNCKHKFHLQCILEWCQRSSNCPLCWQMISLKDAMSQELLEGVVQERNLRSAIVRNATIYHYHPSLGDFDLQHTLQLPIGGGEIELEEHIFQHLAAAAMRRAHQDFRREGQMNHSFSRRHRPLFIFSSPDASENSSVLTSRNQVGGSESASIYSRTGSTLHPNSADDQVPRFSFSQPRTHHASFHRIGSDITAANGQTISSQTRSIAGQSLLRHQDTAEPSDVQSVSESLRSRLNSWSMRYKESFSRTSRGWKERLFARSPSIADVGSEVQNNVPQMMGRLNKSENVGPRDASGSSNLGSRS